MSFAKIHAVNFARAAAVLALLAAPAHAIGQTAAPAIGQSAELQITFSGVDSGLNFFPTSTFYVNAISLGNGGNQVTSLASGGSINVPQGAGFDMETRLSLADPAVINTAFSQTPDNIVHISQPNVAPHLTTMNNANAGLGVADAGGDLFQFVSFDDGALYDRLTWLQPDPTALINVSITEIAAAAPNPGARLLSLLALAGWIAHRREKMG